MLRGRPATILGALALVLALVTTSCASDTGGGTDLGRVGSAAPTSAGGASSGAGSDGAYRPNIVLISTDDQALFEMRWLPQTRRLLGRQGVTFDNFLAPQPLCCPARAQILTGQYAQNNGVHDNSGPHGGVDAFEAAAPTALPVWLQDAGYRTGFAGKYLNQYDETYGVPPGWDEWDATVDGIFDYYGFTQYDGSDLTMPEGHQTDYLAARTADFVAESADDDRPFFFWTSYSAPHGTCLGDTEGGCAVPPIPAERDATRYADVVAPFRDSPGVRERDLSDKPGWIKTNGGERTDAATMQRLFTQRIRSLAAVDDAVATTVRALDDAGELDDTLIAFVSDNGYLFGQHGYTGKIVAYDESLRVPLLMRGPGIPAGVTRSQVGSMTDLAPTVAAFARATPLVDVDGQSLVPTLRGDRGPTDRTLLVQAGWRGPNPQDKLWLFRGVRTQRYLYVAWRTGRDIVELYDHRSDPYELTNLAGEPAYARVEAGLARRTRVLAACEGRGCRRELPRLPVPG